MNLELKRRLYDPNFTIGSLYVDGTFFCDTLEDCVREVENKPVGDWKIYGKTAIPSGRYDIVIDYSNRFKKHLPRLLDVSGFEGIRIHAGNTQHDTHGCILVGKQSGFMLINSRATMDKLMAILEQAYSRPDVPLDIKVTNDEKARAESA